MYPDPNTGKQSTDTLPPASCDDTQKQFRLDLDPDDSQAALNDGSVAVIDDDGDYG